jgi:hypothetical protein
MLAEIAQWQADRTRKKVPGENACSTAQQQVQGNNNLCGNQHRQMHPITLTRSELGNLK